MARRRTLLPIALSLAGLAFLGLGAAPPTLAEEENAAAEATLRAVGVGVDGQALVEFFRQRTTGEALHQRIRDLIRQLGHDEYDARQNATRDLLVIGAPALPALRRAVESTDREVVRRARRCLGTIESLRTDLPMAAAQLLASRPAPGAVEALLAFLPETGDAGVEREVLETLARIGLENGGPHPALVAAALDREPLRRQAAAEVLARSARADHRARVIELLRDPEACVRLVAARGLVLAADERGVVPLMALLEESPPDLAYAAEDVLYRLADNDAPPPLDAGSPESRRLCRQAYEDWWTKQRARVDLVKTFRDRNALGLTLTCLCGLGGKENSGLVEARGLGGKVRWQIGDMGNPTGVQMLPGGRMLITQYRDCKVVERDRHGKIVWEYALGRQPLCAERVLGGNTLIGTIDNHVLEVTREGKVVFNHRAGGMVFAIHRLPSGRVVYLTTGEIVELTSNGAVVRRIRAGSIASWGGLQVLPGGRFLVAQYAAGKVVELDREGNVLWECAASNPASAVRLSNGHVLVAEAEKKRLVEFDRAGQEVAVQELPGRPFFVRRY